MNMKMTCLSISEEYLMESGRYKRKREIVLKLFEKNALKRKLKIRQGRSLRNTPGQNDRSQHPGPKPKDFVLMVTVDVLVAGNGY